MLIKLLAKSFDFSVGARRALGDARDEALRHGHTAQQNSSTGRNQPGGVGTGLRNRSSLLTQCHSGQPR
jgi:hypothetical protein